jgi:hypothetical protein
MVYKVFTIRHGTVERGAEVQLPRYRGRIQNLPAIVVGEQGVCGRKALGIIPVENPELVPCPDRGKELCTAYAVCKLCHAPLQVVDRCRLRAKHPDEGKAFGRLLYARVVEENRRRFRLFAESRATVSDHALVVFETPIGHHGTNSHSGDRCGWRCHCGATGDDLVPPPFCPVCGEPGYWGWPTICYLPFPGKVLAQGRVVSEAGGKTRGGRQIVALIPQSVVFRTGYTGHMFGGVPAEYYYLWDSEHLIGGVTYEGKFF